MVFKEALKIVVGLALMKPFALGELTDEERWTIATLTFIIKERDDNA